MSVRTRKNKRQLTGSAVTVRTSSGNVFEDLGVVDSAEALAKADIAAQISLAIQRRGLTQARAAALFHVDQADVSDLVRGKLRGFSTDRLIRFLNALGQDVDIVIHERRRSKRPGKLSVLHRIAATRG